MILVFSVTLIALISAMLTVTQNLQRQIQGTALRITARNMEQAIAIAFDSPDVCACHFDESKNADAKSFRINTDQDTSTTPLADLEIPELRAGCDFSNSKNVLASTKQGAPPSSQVQKIVLRGLRKTATDQYEGDLLIQLKETGLQIAPVPLRMSVTVDSTKGSSNARPLLSCVKSNGNVARTSCPPGTVFVGYPGKFEAYCMEEKLRPAETALRANTICASATLPGINRSFTCTVGLWTWACHHKIGDLGAQEEIINAANWQVIPNGISQYGNTGTAGGAAGCASFGVASFTTKLPFRCCHE